VKRLVSTELLKLRTTRTTFFVVGGGLAIAALIGLASALVAGDPGAPPLGSASWVDNLVGVSAIPAVVAVLLGVLLAAGEQQHQTITTTFLVTPRRERVVAAKALAAGIAGPLLATAMIATTALAALPVVVAEGAGVDMLRSDTAFTIAGLLGAASLLGGVGVLLGFLVRSQVAAVVVVAAWALVLEGIVDTLVGGGLRRWLPGGAAAELAGNGSHPLAVEAAVLAAWTLVMAALAVPAVVRRDVA
jgi:hypothetical protein